MNKLEQAARQALEALEQLQGGCTDSNDGTVEAITVWCPDVIAALREALEEAPKSVRRPLTDEQDQAEFRQFLSDVHTAAGLISHGKQSKHLGDRLSVAVMKMYTAPQPTRHPLTDKEIQDVWCSAKDEGNQYGPFWFARAIEKAHGIE